MAGLDPRGQALAQAIEDDPDDIEAYRVYADWLGELGDPRSQLVGMQVLRDRLTDKHKLAHLAVRLEEFFEAHLAHFLGPLARYVATSKMPRGQRDRMRQRFTWRYGFIHGAHLACEDASKRGHERVDQILEHLLVHPSGRFLVELRLEWPERPDLVFDVLARHAPGTLRKLALNVTADLTPLWPTLSRLHHLEVESGAVVADLDLPALRTARFKGIHDAASLAAITAGRWPRLELLHVTLGSLKADADAFQPLFARSDLPALHRLELRHVPVLDELLRRFARSPLSRHVRELDLRHGDRLTDTGVRDFLALDPAPLDSLTIPNVVAADTIASLARIAGRVLVKAYGDDS